jgi:serine/threonine protein kinase
LRYLHLHSVIHGDLSIRNIALDEHFDFKLLDFGGSSIDGSEMLVECSPRYHRPHSWRFPLPGVDEVNENWKKPTRKIDTYALGTVLFEIFTWSEMYTGRQYDEVRRHATNREYPDLGVIEVDKIREVIRECWSEKYDGVDEIIQDLGTSWSDAREAVRCSLC